MHSHDIIIHVTQPRMHVQGDQERCADTEAVDAGNISSSASTHGMTVNVAVKNIAQTAYKAEMATGGTPANACKQDASVPRAARSRQSVSTCPLSSLKKRARPQLAAVSFEH